MRRFLACYVFAGILTACAGEALEEGGAADIQGEDEKEDGTSGIEVSGRLRPGTVDATLTTRVPRPGYVFYAGDGAKVTLEVTRGGTSSGLDTQLKVYGPRLSDGSYPKTLATDDDSGYGKLSRVKDLAISIPGFYLVEVTTPAPQEAATARIKLSCSGTCDSDLPIAPLGLDIKWFQRAAERKALSLQTYATATAKVEARVAEGVPANWGVILDIDETVLDNSPYQKERADLGLGYSPQTWRGWVERKAAEPLAGAPAFIARVRELGGKVVFVTNRIAAFECAPTEANLAAKGISYDAIICKAGSSDKNPRFQAVANGTAKPGLPALEVVAYVGDNIQDFPALSQDVRKQPDSAFAAFGETFFVLPNPMYGSWEKNVD